MCIKLSLMHWRNRLFPLRMGISKSYDGIRLRSGPPGPSSLCDDHARVAQINFKRESRLNPAAKNAGFR